MNREHGVQYQAQISMNWLCSTVEFSCWKQVPKICPALLFFFKKAYILIRLNLGFVQSRSLCFNSEHGENLPMCCIRSSFWEWLGEFLPFSFLFTVECDLLYLIQRTLEARASLFLSSVCVLEVRSIACSSVLCIRRNQYAYRSEHFIPCYFHKWMYLILF